MAVSLYKPGAPTGVVATLGEFRALVRTDYGRTLGHRVALVGHSRQARRRDPHGAYLAPNSGAPLIRY